MLIKKDNIQYVNKTNMAVWVIVSLMLEGLNNEIINTLFTNIDFSDIDDCMTYYNQNKAEIDLLISNDNKLITKKTSKK